MNPDYSIALPDEAVMQKIYLVRGQKVMFDKDLAELYGVETKALNQAVKRNRWRFPEDFMFQLSIQEWENLKSQFVTSKWGGTRKVPNVFTEQGIAMLSSVLHSETAIRVNIRIIRIFTQLRQMLQDNTEIRLDIENIRKKLDHQGKNIDLLFGYLDELLEKLPSSIQEEQPIGFRKNNRQ